MSSQPKNAVCNTCTLKLASVAYRRAPWFRIVREPLKFGMRMMVRIYRIDANEYAVRTPACHNCIRFCKTALKERSRFFRALHTVVNPAFDYLLERIITGQELASAKSYAKRATAGDATQPEVNDWMEGMRTGL